MEQGKAAAGDLRPGDVIVSINGESAAEMLNVEAQNKIKQSPGELRLQVERWARGRGGEGSPRHSTAASPPRASVSPGGGFGVVFPLRHPPGLRHPCGEPGAAL